MLKYNYLFIVLIPLMLNACAKKGGSAPAAASAKPNLQTSTQPPVAPGEESELDSDSDDVSSNPGPAQRVINPKKKKSRRQADPMARQKRLTRTSFGYAKVIRCRFEPTGKPISFLEYHINSRIAYTTTGWPQVTRVYKDIRITDTLPPYRNTGITLLAFVDSPLIHIRRGGNGTIWYEQGTYYPFEATWGLQPGAPTRENRLGVCWTPEEPAQTPYQGIGG